MDFSPWKNYKNYKKSNEFSVLSIENETTEVMNDCLHANNL